jgi:hypothetical protein
MISDHVVQFDPLEGLRPNVIAFTFCAVTSRITSFTPGSPYN